MTRPGEQRCLKCGLSVSPEIEVLIDGGIYHPFCARRKRSGEESSENGRDRHPPVRARKGDDELLDDWSFRHLLDTEPGEEVRVRDILFEPLRNLCRTRGLQPGVRLRVQERDRREVRVRLPGGKLLGVEAHVAQLIEIDVGGPGTAR